MSVGTNIKRLRIDAGLTQEELAQSLGVARSTVTQWERGWTQPRMGMVHKLAVFFGTTNSVIVKKKTGNRTPLASRRRRAFPLMKRREITA